MTARRSLVAGLLVLAPAVASAQSVLFPNGPGRAPAPHWRAGLGAGITTDGSTAAYSLSVERTVRGPFSAGGRVTLYAEGGFMEDDSGAEGFGADVFAAASARHRILDLRTFAGVGLSATDYTELYFDPTDESFEGVDESSVRPRVFAGAGLDVYPFAGIGVGVDARGALSRGVPSFSEVNLGLRVRLAR